MLGYWKWYIVKAHTGKGTKDVAGGWEMGKSAPCTLTCREVFSTSHCSHTPGETFIICGGYTAITAQGAGWDTYRTVVLMIRFCPWLVKSTLVTSSLVQTHTFTQSRHGPILFLLNAWLQVCMCLHIQYHCLHSWVCQNVRSIILCMWDWTPNLVTGTRRSQTISVRCPIEKQS